MNVLKEYQPLYSDDYFIIDCYGGRAGARSYHKTQRALYLLLNKKDFRGFFLRQTNSTIYTSMWADFKDRINEYNEIHQTDLSNIIQYTDNKHGENTAINLLTGGTITTKGFQISSGQNTASLKSLAGATDVFIDELDEVGKKPFNKLKLSLRKKGVKIQIVRAFNPPDINHWIWEDYDLKKVTSDELLKMVYRHSSLDQSLLKKIVESNSKTYYTAKPKHENHKQIFSTYINNFDNLNETAILEYDKDLLNDFHDYCVSILGLIPASDGDVIYTDYDSDLCHTDRDYRNNEPLHIGMDFNIGKMRAVVYVIENKNKYAINEFKGYDTRDLCEVIKTNYPYSKITIYPDSSGKNRKTSGVTDFETIRSFGWQILARESNPKVRDRINAMNTGFRTGTLKVNKYKCPEFSEALKKHKYKDGAPDKSSEFDHINDAGGYPIAYYNNSNNYGSIKV